MIPSDNKSTLHRELTTSAQTIFDERRDSFKQCLSAILDKFNSSNNLFNNNNNTGGIEKQIELIINKCLANEREVFLSYLIYLLMKNQKQIMPPFFEEFRESKEKLDAIFDKKGEIRKCLKSYSNIINYRSFSNYVSKIASIFYGTSFLHSIVNDYRSIFTKFISSTIRLIHETNKKAVITLQKVSNHKIIQKKDEELKLLSTQFNKVREILKERDKNRLEIEGHVIRIIQYINSIDPKKVEDTPTSLTLEELKKQSKGLRNILKATTSNEKIEFSTNLNSHISNTNFDELIRQSKVKDETILQLRKEVESLRNNSSISMLTSNLIGNQSQSKINPYHIEENVLQSNLLKTKGELLSTQQVKSQLMNEVVQKTDKLRDYYEMKSNFEDLKLEYHALKQQKIQSDEYAETLNQENIKLRKSNEDLKMQLSSGNAGFEALYDKVARLDEKQKRRKEKLREEKENTSKIEAELQQKNQEIQSYVNKLKSLTEDHDSSTIKNDLLMEQITNLKTEIAMKENEFAKFQQNLEAQKKLYDTAQERENQKIGEINLLNEKIEKIKLKAAKKDEKIQQLQKLVDNSTLKIQEKNLLMEKYELKINDFKSKIVTLTDKLGKAAEIIGNQKNKIKDFENSVADLHFQLKEADRKHQQNEIELKELKESNQNMMEISKAKEELDRKLFQTNLELESQKQKNGIISGNLNSQIEANEQLRTELSETKKKSNEINNQYETLKFQNQTQITQLQNDINALKFDSEKEKERFEIEKTELTNKIQQSTTKIQSFNQIKEQFENQIIELKQKTADLQDQLTESNAQSKQKIIELQHVTQTEKLELNDKIASSEKKSKELESKNTELKKQIKNVKNDYDEFKLKIIQMLNLNQKQQNRKKKKQSNIDGSNVSQMNKDDILAVEDDFIFKKLQDIQSSLTTADSFMNTFNNEINKTKDRNQSLFDELSASSLSTLVNSNEDKQLTPFEQISMLTQAVDASAQMIENYKKQQEHQSQILRQVQLDSIDEIPELNKTVNDAKQESLHYLSIIRQIGESMPFERIEMLPRMIAELMLNREKLQAESNKFNKIMKLLHKYIVFDNDEDVVASIRDLSNEEKRKSNQISLLNKDFQDTIKTKADYEEKLIQLSHVLNIQNFDEIPQTVEKLSTKSQQNQTELNNLQSNYSSLIGQVSQIMETDLNIPTYNSNNNNSPTSLKKQTFSIVQNVKQLTQFNQKMSEELRIAQKELEEKSDLLLQVQKITETQGENDLPKKISNLIESKTFYESELKKNKEKHNNFVYQLSSITKTEEEDKIPLTIIKILQQQKETEAELENSKKDHQDLIESIQQVIQFKTEKQIPKILSNMIEKQKVSDSRIELLDQVEKMTFINDDSQLVKSIDKIFEESQNHQKMMKSFQSILSFSNVDEAIQTVQDKINILAQVQSSLSLQNQTDLPMKIEDLKEISKSHSNLVRNVQNVINFENEDQIPQKIKEIVNQTEEQTKVISNIEKFINPFNFENEDDRTLTNESINFSNSLLFDNNNNNNNNFDNSFAKSRIQNIPKMIEKIVSDNQRLKEQHNDLLSSIHDVVSFNDESEIPLILSKLINSNSKKQEKVSFSRSIFQSIHDCLPFEKVEDVPQMIYNMNKTIERLASKEEKYESVLGESKSIIELDDLDSLPSKLNELKKTEKVFEKLVSSLQSILNVSNINEIINKANQLVNDQDRSNEILREINSTTPIQINSIGDVLAYSKQIQSVLNSIKPMINADVSSNFEILPKIFKNLKETEKNYSNLVELFKQILLRIYGNESQINSALSFPLSDENSKKILSLIADYAINFESMKTDTNRILSSAKSLGFSGSSIVEASDFLAEQMCKKKAQEQLEEMVNQMKKLREDKDRERKLFEQRNAKNNEKIKQVREAKAQLIEQYSQKQSELYDTIESLQKDTRELENRVEKLTRVKEELIRVAANEPYDKESLLTWLTTTEKIKLKL